VGGVRLPTPVDTSPEAHAVSHTVGTVVLLQVKPRGIGVNHTPPSSAEVKERIELYTYVHGAMEK